MTEEMENYEQKYNEALGRARKLGTREMPIDPMYSIQEQIFPELKESEDERIRKAQLDYWRSVGGNEWHGVPVQETIAWLEKQGENKPVDNVEPKFKQGEWIVWQDKCYKVNYNDCGYELVDQNGLSTSLEYGTVDENAHLWDIIQDAKAGDVLYCDNSNTKTIYLFKEQRGLSNVATAYFQILNLNNELRLVFNKAADFNLNTCPATKEQRDLLFSKMKEAGYEWDYKKKELKKIEQKSTWSEEDELMIQDAIHWIQEFQKSDRCKDENDMQNSVTCENWLKSLKPNHWKPSEDQMLALETAIRCRSMPWEQLGTLYNDLKTL